MYNMGVGRKRVSLLKQVLESNLLAVFFFSFYLFFSSFKLNYVDYSFGRTFSIVNIKRLCECVFFSRSKHFVITKGYVKSVYLYLYIKYLS